MPGSFDSSSFESTAFDTGADDAQPSAGGLLTLLLLAQRTQAVRLRQVVYGPKSGRKR